VIDRNLKCGIAKITGEKKGQSLIELALLMNLLLVLWLGARYVFNCIDAKLVQQLALRKHLFETTSAGFGRENGFPLYGIYAYIKQGITGQEIMAETAKVPVPALLAGKGGNTEIRTGLTVFGGCWNSAGLVEMVKRTRYENSSLEELLIPA